MPGYYSISKKAHLQHLLFLQLPVMYVQVMFVRHWLWIYGIILTIIIYYILEMRRYRIWKYRCIAPKISRYNDIIIAILEQCKFSYKTVQLSSFIQFYCNANSIIWLVLSNYKYACHVVQVNTSDYCDTWWINTLIIVSIPVSLFCILRYSDASMYHPISTIYYTKLLYTVTVQVVCDTV